MPAARRPALPRRQALVVGAAALATLGTTARAETWPARPITLIAPYPPGGGVDAVARLVAERLAQRLGQAVNVDNKPGAGATLGAAALARSAPDGYTLMLGSIVDYAIAPHVHKALPFDQQRDFIPVVELGFGTVALVVHADLPARNVAELVALAKAKPGVLSYGSTGVGGLQHLNELNVDVGQRIDFRNGWLDRVPLEILVYRWSLSGYRISSNDTVPVLVALDKGQLRRVGGIAPTDLIESKRRAGFERTLVDD